MNQQLNYEDNIFILNSKIRVIADMLMLDADPDIFLEKTLEDIDFIAAKLTLLRETLTLNTQLISRSEQFHNLDETCDRFLDLLNNMLRGDGCFCAKNYPIVEEPVNILIAHCLNQQKLIKSAVTEGKEKAPDPRLVSADELSALLDGM
ncbi:MAG: hypothetical protein LBH18_03235 [Spirochaetaceae bacterium]|jgi:hypothetical protein|nr:hypothetical protein [Spirochaetaceae bacterium]